MGGERRPEVAHPLALAVEALGPGGAGADVERERGAAPVEGAVVVVHPGHRPAHLPDRIGGQRGLDPQRVLDRDVDDLVAERVHVAGAEVVVTAGDERRVEHRLVGDERLGLAQVQQRRAERTQRPQHLFALLQRSRVAAGDRHH